MATSAESAQAWVNEKHPSNEEILSVIQKLETRIDSWEGDEDSIQGSIDAVDYLHGQLEPSQNEAQQSPIDTSPLSTEVGSSLDSSSLIPDAQPVELAQDVKRAAFDALKAQLSK